VSNAKGRRSGLQRKPTSKSVTGDVADRATDHPLADQVARDNAALVVPVSKINTSTANPRQTFDEASLAELAADISANGLINPLTVVAEGASYRLIAGERRYRAAQQLGLADVPVRVVNESAAAVIQLSENLQREDLPLLEEVRAFAGLQQHLQLTVRELADKVHKSRGYVQRRLAILNWPEDVQALLQSEPGLLTVAEKIAAIADPQRRAARIRAIVGGEVPSAVPVREPGRPAEPFRLKERKRGGFDVTVHYRPGASNRTQLIEQLRNVLSRLEQEE